MGCGGRENEMLKKENTEKEGQSERRDEP